MGAGSKVYMERDKDGESMTVTKKYGFRKPGASDFISIDDLNYNVDIAEKAINDIEEKAKATQQVKIVDLTLNGWSESYPYSQAVTVAGIKDTDAPILSLYLPQGLNAIAVKAKSKAFSCLYRAVSSSGRITFYAYKKPETDFLVSIKGV